MKLPIQPTITSNVVIVWATLMHFFEGAVLLTIYPVPRSVPMAAFLSVFPDQFLAGTVLWIFAGLACFGQWCPHRGPMERFCLLLPQASLLFIAAFGALYFISHGTYADGVVRPSISFILPDQASRIGMPFFYVAALFSRVRNGT